MAMAMAMANGDSQDRRTELGRKEADFAKFSHKFKYHACTDDDDPPLPSSSSRLS